MTRPITPDGPTAEALEQAFALWGRRPRDLLQVLRHVHERIGHLSPASIERIANELGVSLARVRGVASFYAFLDEVPRGEVRVLFSDNVTDRMQGSEDLLAEMCRRLWVERGRVSEDGIVSVDTTSCTGLCDQGPALLVNGRAIPRLGADRVAQICELILAREPVERWPRELFVIEDHVRRAGPLLASRMLPGDALRAAIARAAEDPAEAAASARSWREAMPERDSGPQLLIDEIRRSALRGRGGAGFTTGAKWQACRDAPGARRVVVCNADEGEPGTFKDRVLLHRHANLVFEGMTLAAYAVGADEGFLYLRGEYRFLLEPLLATLEARRRGGLLGKSICGQRGFDFDIQLHVGAGAYVCGEESALIESLEGKRGVPRNRPPYPVTQGYLGRPTVVNNVETLCAAAWIAVEGADAWRALGTNRSTGSKLLSVAGDCERPGIYEVPFGTTVREVLADCGATRTQAVQISGPSGTCISVYEADRRIAFEDLLTAGAFTVFDDRRDMFEVARAYTQFFAHESCGFCTPCRVGTSMLARILDKLHAGHGTLYDLQEIERLDKVLGLSAHCGLGHTACNPTLDTLKRFRPAYNRRLKSLDFSPAFDLDGALAAARQATGRDDRGAHLPQEPQETRV
jgi:[NiFe] hydrogenase diaphorase moiety large subunit